jgi:hypothetical protein
MENGGIVSDEQNLIKALGIESLPDDQKIRILEQCVQVVEQRLLLRLMKSLDDPKRNELNEILASRNNQALEQFTAREAPDFIDWIKEETERVRADLKSLGEIEV